MNINTAIARIARYKENYEISKGFALNWERLGRKSAEVLVNVIKTPVLFKSYNTIVGVIEDGTFYELGKYRATTSKQVTLFCRAYGLDRVLLERPENPADNTWYSVKY